MRTEMITLGHGASGLKIELRAKPLTNADVTQGVIRFVVGFREANRRPLRYVEVSGVCGVILASAGRKIGCAEIGVVVPHLPHLAGAGDGKIPGVPGCGEDVLSA